MTFILKDNEKEFILNEKIGEGATCECFLGQKKDEVIPKIIAIKIFQEKYYQYYLNEISFLSILNDNDNIIKLISYGKGVLTPLTKINSCNNNTDCNIIYYQVLEYAINGELKDYVNGTSSRIPEKISAKLFIKIVYAVKYLHENNIAHCDLKPENILLDYYFNPKINDFGFSQKFNGKNGDFLIHKRSGTPNYSSPDVKHAFTKGYNGIKNDIFSLGVLLFVITIGEFPFETPTYSDERYKFIIKGQFDRFWKYFSEIDVSDEFKDLINNLISLNPSKRLTTDEILKHPWLIKQLGLNPNKDNEYIINEVYDKELIDEFNSRKKLI